MMTLEELTRVLGRDTKAGKHITDIFAVDQNIRLLVVSLHQDLWLNVEMEVDFKRLDRELKCRLAEAGLDVPVVYLCGLSTDEVNLSAAPTEVLLRLKDLVNEQLYDREMEQR